MRGRDLQELLPGETEGHRQPCSREGFPASLVWMLQRNGLIPCLDQRKKSPRGTYVISTLLLSF